MEILYSNFKLLVPLAVLVLMGFLMRKKGVVSDSFVTEVSRALFQVFLPIFIFTKTVSSSQDLSADLNLLIICSVGIILMFSLARLAVKVFKVPLPIKNDFVQASFRSNFGIFGLALVALAAPERLPTATITLSVVSPIYAVLTLWQYSTAGNGWRHYGAVLFNPLIVAGVLGLLLRGYGVKPPGYLVSIFSQTNDIVIPLALVAVGASLTAIDFSFLSKTVWAAIFVKLVLSPVLLVGFCILYGMNHSDLVVIFALFGAPTATVALPFSQALGGDGSFTSKIIVVTTLVSALTTFIGLSVLNLL